LATKVASEGEIEAMITPNFSPKGADTDEDAPSFCAQVRDAIGKNDLDHNTFGYADFNQSL